MTNYPLANFQFIVEWGSGTKTGFTEVTGLTISNQVIEYRDGNSAALTSSKMPGLRKYDNIILKRGLFSGDNDFYNWINTIALNTVERQTISISLMDASKNPIVTWSVINAWPCRLSYSNLKSDESHSMMEELEIVHEGWTVQNTGTTA